MAFFKVSFEGGHVLYVNAPDATAAAAHVDHDLVRDPHLKHAGVESPPSRPQIPQRATVVTVEAEDKGTVRRRA